MNFLKMFSNKKETQEQVKKVISNVLKPNKDW